MRELYLVADDLTGALDTAAQFTGRLGPIYCAPHPPATNAPADISVAINGACREGTEAAAVAVARLTLPLLAGARLSFKKIDSLLRGHWAAELAAIVDARCFERVILCPAFPAQGRVTRGGTQYLVGQAGSLSKLPVDPMVELKARGLRVWSGSPDNIAAANNAEVLLFDADTDHHLAAVVTAASRCPGPLLWCGSAGLARGLSGRPPLRLAVPDGPHLAIFGTRHPVSEAQVDWVRGLSPRSVVEFDDSGARAAAAVSGALTEFGFCCALLGPRERLSPKEAEVAIQHRLRAIIEHCPTPGSITISGGDAFLALCDALESTRLVVSGEVLPGMPFSRPVGGAWDGVPAISKSGAFGNQSDLATLFGVSHSV